VPVPGILVLTAGDGIIVAGSDLASRGVRKVSRGRLEAYASSAQLADRCYSVSFFMDVAAAAGCVFSRGELDAAVMTAISSGQVRCAPPAVSSPVASD
jgi:hypothetical protein